jgi:hypothetical protein
MIARKSLKRLNILGMILKTLVIVYSAWVSTVVEMFKSMCVIIINIKCKAWKSKDIIFFVLTLLLVVLVGYVVIFTNEKIVLEFKCEDWEKKDGLSTKFCSLKIELLKIESILQFLHLKYYPKKTSWKLSNYSNNLLFTYRILTKKSPNHYYLHTLVKLNMRLKNRTKAKSKQKSIIVLISKFLLYVPYILGICYCNNYYFFLVLFMIILMEED